MALLIGIDSVALPFCFTVALLLRDAGSYNTGHAILVCLLVTLTTIAGFHVVGLYRAVIRYIDYQVYVKTAAGLLGAVLVTQASLAVLGLQRVPAGAVTIYAFVAFFYGVTSRFIARALLRSRIASPQHCGRTAVAIYGAGEAGTRLAAAMESSREYRPVCFLDDNPLLSNRNVAGLDVYHASRLKQAVKANSIALIVVAAPSATRQQRKEMIFRAQETGIPIKVLGSLLELQDDVISTRSIREIKVEDLLGRDPIAPDSVLLTACTSEKTVLVTGAGGSIGSELCRQIMLLKPSRLHLLDHSEHALYTISKELSDAYPDAAIEPHLGSVCIRPVVDRIFSAGRIDTIYHAAAYKHVPLVEENISEGLLNNVFGAKCIAEAAENYRAGTCVLISSDKAVRPTSVMGASKRIAELIFQAASARQNSATKYCMVRFGNVLGSSGSVIPLFKRQIERGGPITVTDRDVTRYFMSVQEAAQLVIQAGAMAKDGEVFVMDMGVPIKIVDVARSMIAMAGLVEKTEENPLGDIEILITGLRSGEKLHEELFTSNNAVPSAHPRILTTTDYMIEPRLLEQMIDALRGACVRDDLRTVELVLRNLVRGYVSNLVKAQGDPFPEARPERPFKTA
jgi:FlaA1/EpsC-like NDP-sugar epimerase